MQEEQPYKFDENESISEEPEFEDSHWENEEEDDILTEMGIDFDDD